ncbi:hypothetical protein Taro_054333 [Colocasia esculenta]|uniref:BURP domain-containing protein n=1 Tax=Colocasia esculenta TaxID=4460 RepID=A0A843XQS5_COLES|nr:hypothetical protein [Colocasia esculenta]
MDHSISALLFLVLYAAVACAAAVLPQNYWKQMLPNTPMPVPIRELFLPADVGDRKTTSDGALVKDGEDGKIIFANNLPATEAELSNDANAEIFFLEKDLHPGDKRKLHFTRRTPEATFIPRPVADAFPFSTEKLPEILTLFSIKTDSKEAEDMKNSLLPCDAADPGEAKFCATSLESMVDFAISSLGTSSVQALSSEGSKKRQFYSVVPSGVQSMVAEGENTVSCHALPYPYAVFFCHAGTSANKVYKVKLVGEDGGRATAIAVCHTKTSGWHPKHLAFQVLKVEPGTTICHFFPQDNVVWIPRR